MEAPTADLSPGKAYHILCSMVAPRPIAWVTTCANGVVNAAPFSWFQAVCADPPMVMIAVVDKPDHVLKDTARNIRDTGEFVVNIARGEQLEALVATSAPLAPDASEIDAADLATWPSTSVAPPRIVGCAGHLECRLVESHRYGRDNATTVFIGEVVHMALDDAVATPRGLLDPVAAALPARLHEDHYLRVVATERVVRPEQGS